MSPGPTSSRLPFAYAVGEIEVRALRSNETAVGPASYESAGLDQRPGRKLGYARQPGRPVRHGTRHPLHKRARRIPVLPHTEHLGRRPPACQRHLHQGRRRRLCVQPPPAISISADCRELDRALRLLVHRGQRLQARRVRRPGGPVQRAGGAHQRRLPTSARTTPTPGPTRQRLLRQQPDLADDITFTTQYWNDSRSSAYSTRAATAASAWTTSS